jgi:Fe-S cluster biosynthesis and repair protein YggX
MSRMIFCVKFQEELEGLDYPTYPGELGQKIYDQVSKKAWAQWLKQQTMLINEYRFNLTDPKARAFLAAEMEKYFFGEGSELPSGYKPLPSE